MIVTFLPPWISVSLLLNKLCPCGHVETGSLLYRCFVFHGISLLIEADVVLRLHSACVVCHDKGRWLLGVCIPSDLPGYLCK